MFLAPTCKLIHGQTVGKLHTNAVVVAAQVERLVFEGIGHPSGQDVVLDGCVQIEDGRLLWPPEVLRFSWAASVMKQIS